MIRKLKIKFIALAMTALFIMLVVIVVVMNVVNYTSLINEADMKLSFISENKGKFPSSDDFKGEKYPAHISLETPYESRYFSVLLSNDGDIISTETSKIVSVNSEQAVLYAKSVISSSESVGFSEDFRYLKSFEGHNIRITFLDCGSKLDSFLQYLYVSVGVALGGLLVMFFGIAFFAGKIVHPVAEGYDKQKHFITDAGHEMKTPLTIISANVDMLRLDPTDTDCLNDIQMQTERLARLTNDLVYLAKMEENDKPEEMVDIPLSDIVSETTMAFNSLVQTQEKELIHNIQPMISFKGNHKTIEQLMSILMDNALKYSPTGGTVAVNLTRNNRIIQLHVYNTTETYVEQEKLKYVFERFYRTDKSRNSETGGHGIGLSVAKAIVEAHDGKIQAWTKDGHSFNITCTFFL